MAHKKNLVNKMIIVSLLCSLSIGWCTNCYSEELDEPEINQTVIDGKIDLGTDEVDADIENADKNLVLYQPFDSRTSVSQWSDDSSVTIKNLSDNSIISNYANITADKKITYQLQHEKKSRYSAVSFDLILNKMPLVFSIDFLGEDENQTLTTLEIKNGMLSVSGNEQNVLLKIDQNVWYRISMAFDKSKGSFDIYISGNRYTEVFKCKKDTVSAIKFGTDGEEFDIGVDNIYLYSSDDAESINDSLKTKARNENLDPNHEDAKFSDLILDVPTYLDNYSEKPDSHKKYVDSYDTFINAMETAVPGDVIVFKNGVYENFNTTYDANGILRSVITEIKTIGSETAPVIIRAETPGKVIFKGFSQFMLKGEYTIFKDFVFEDVKLNEGVASNRDILTLSGAKYCRVTGCAFINCGRTDSPMSRIIVALGGTKYSRIDHNLIDNPLSMSIVIDTQKEFCNVVDYNHIKNVKKVVDVHNTENNNGMEPIQIGAHSTEGISLNTFIEHNLFEDIVGDQAEIISNKGPGNIYRNNTFINCDSGITNRGYDGCIYEGNFVVNQTKGLRIYGKNHRITNNYFYGVDRVAIELGAGSFAYSVPNNCIISNNTVLYPGISAFTVANDYSFSLGRLTGDPLGTLYPIDGKITNNVFVTAGESPAVVDNTLSNKYENNIYDIRGITQLGNPPENATLYTFETKTMSTDNKIVRMDKDKQMLVDKGSFVTGMKLDKDIEGRVRYSQPDIGAFEFNDTDTVHKFLTKYDVGPEWKTGLLENEIPTLTETFDNSVVLKLNSYRGLIDGLGTNLDQLNPKTCAPYEEEGTIYLPLRFVSESLGATVLWSEGGTNIKYNDVTAVVNDWSDVVTVNGTEIKLKNIVTQRENRMYVPVDFIESVLNKPVQLISDRSLIIIGRTDISFQPETDWGAYLIKKMNSQLKVIKTEAPPSETTQNETPQYIEGTNTSEVVKRIQVYTNGEYSDKQFYAQQKLAVGSKLYSDAAFTYKEIPDELLGADFIQTRNDFIKKDEYRDLDAMTMFETHENVCVYLGFAGEAPEWAAREGYVNTDMTLKADCDGEEVTYTVYKKSYPLLNGKDTKWIELGGNGELLYAYTVAIKSIVKKKSEQVEVSNIVVHFNGEYKTDYYVAKNDLQNDKLVYLDRGAVTYANLSDKLKGNTYIMTNNSDKNDLTQANAADYFTFDVDRSVSVYVIWHSGDVPVWLGEKGFVQSYLTAFRSESGVVKKGQVYQKDYILYNNEEKQTITLGGLGTRCNAVYTVVILPGPDY